MPKGKKIVYPWLAAAKEARKEEERNKWDKRSLRVYLVGQQNLKVGWPWVAYKIGISDNPNKRLSGLQTGNPAPLELITVFHGHEPPHTTERALHVKFARYQTYNGGREWFWDNPDIRDFIRQASTGIEGYKFDYLSPECAELEEDDYASPTLRQTG